MWRGVLCEEDISRFDITVEDTAIMGVIDTAADGDEGLWP